MRHIVNALALALGVAAALSVCGCSFGHPDMGGVPSLSSLVVGERPMAFSSDCGRTCHIVCPEGWRSCGEEREGTVTLPASVLTGTQIRTQAHPAPEPTVRVPVSLMEGAEIHKRGEDGSVPVRLRVRHDVVPEATDGEEVAPVDETPTEVPPGEE